MIYCNQVPKRDLLNGNLRFYQVRNHVFGAQTFQRCCNEKPTTFFETDKKIALESRKSRFNDLSVKTCLNLQNCRLKSMKATF